MTTPEPFAVDRGLVSELTEFIQNAVARATYVRFDVPAPDFPVWCAALGVESFTAYRGKNGHTWVSTQHSYVMCGQPEVHQNGALRDGQYPGCQHEYRLVSVGCDTPPAPWVQYPGGEGDRRYMFKFEVKEAESE
jgi:hypothetical protein